MKAFRAKEEKTVNTPLAYPPLTGRPFGLTGLFMWLVTARMTKQKREGAVDEKTTMVGRGGERQDVAAMSNGTLQRIFF